MNISDIKQILNDRFLFKGKSLIDKNESGKIILDSRIDFANIEDYVIYRFDPELEDPFPFFTDRKGNHVKKICDFIFFVKQNDSFYTILVEHKSSNNNSANSQLDASKCFVDFIMETAKRIGKDTLNIQLIKVRYVPRLPGTKIDQPTCNNGVISYHFQSFRLMYIIDYFRSEISG